MKASLLLVLSAVLCLGALSACQTTKGEDPKMMTQTGSYDDTQQPVIGPSPTVDYDDWTDHN